MPRSMLLWTTRTPANRATASLEFVRFFQLNRWLIFLVALPLIVLITLLAIFFFAIFAGLFAAMAVVIALRVWWLRRKLRYSAVADNMADRPVVTTETKAGIHQKRPEIDVKT